MQSSYLRHRGEFKRYHEQIHVISPEVACFWIIKCEHDFGATQKGFKDLFEKFCVHALDPKR